MHDVWIVRETIEGILIRNHSILRRSRNEGQLRSEGVIDILCRFGTGDLGLEGRSDLEVDELLPVDCLEEWMVLDALDAVVAETLLGITIQKLGTDIEGVDESRTQTATRTTNMSKRIFQRTCRQA